MLLIFRIKPHFILAKRPMKTELRRKNKTHMRGVVRATLPTMLPVS